MNYEEFHPTPGHLLVKHPAENPMSNVVATPDTLMEVNRHTAEIIWAGSDSDWKPGDLVYAQAYSFERLDDKYSILRDSDVMAYSNDGDEVIPANGNVSVFPETDLRTDPVTGARVREAKNGVLIAAPRGSVPGYGVRFRKRGKELWDQMQELVGSKQYQEQPSAYYKRCMLDDFIDSLCGWEQEALDFAYQRNGETDWEDNMPMVKPTIPWKGQVEAKAKDVSLPLSNGDWIWFDKEYKALVLYSNKPMFLLPQEQVAAIET